MFVRTENPLKEFRKVLHSLRAWSRMTSMTDLETYYNKFNEEKRLLRPYGQVEYRTSMVYIHKCLEQLMQEMGKCGAQGDISDANTAESGIVRTPLRIADLGAGTGRYALPLAAEGHDVTAVELVNYNLGIMKQKAERKGISLTAMKGNALKLKKLADNSFDLTLLFGPMYHLFTMEEKVQALSEAKRITRPGGYLLVAYCMNEYCILTYAFKEGHFKECMEEGRLTEDFHSSGSEKDLYDYVRIEDINAYNEAAGLTRERIVSADGPANYMREMFRDMDEETFEGFMRYHLSVCERPDLIGACAHTLDILRVNKEEPS